MAIDCATVLGIVGTFKVLGMPIAREFLKGPFDSLYRFGAIAFAVLMVLVLLIYTRFPQALPVCRRLSLRRGPGSDHVTFCN